MYITNHAWGAFNYIIRYFFNSTTSIVFVMDTPETRKSNPCS